MIYWYLKKGGYVINIDPAYVGTLSNGVEYKIHQSSGLSNKCDLAISINGEYVSVMTVFPKRSGSIEITPMNIGKIIIKSEYKEQAREESAKIDLLSDVIAPPNPANISDIFTNGDTNG